MNAVPECWSSVALYAASWSWMLDGWIIVTGALAAVACSLLGNFLVLRKMSMLGDAITHAVLPGIAVAFFLSQTRNSLPMFLGAVVVGVLTALFTEWIRSTGGVDEGASMGVVFTSLFALGLILLVQTADSVDLDPNCVLYGSIELTPLDTVSLDVGWLGMDRQEKTEAGRLLQDASGQAALEVPRAALILGIVAVLNGIFVALFFKELRLTSFDPALADTMGFSSKWMHYGLMVLVSVTAVACFESVGSILVVAMLIVPPAAAYMLTDRLGWMIAFSAMIAVAAAVTGHLSASWVPGWFGYGSTTTAGMIAVAAGGLFFIAAMLSPQHGILVKWVRRQMLSLRILCDDVVAFLFRGEELNSDPPDAAYLASELFTSRGTLSAALWILRRRRELDNVQGVLRLSPSGRERAQRLIRSHRLWEQYLVDRAGSGPERIHEQAERFEHFTDRELREKLAHQTDGAEHDPHGRPIPEES